ncbi:hypothetical protein [Hyphococcus sp.]|jgi:hypothetical protein|uniref:hypothetical protein n=1 Tax=Hyphococcus sp. TaxID=2038636 RepID=UPI003D14D040
MGRKNRESEGRSRAGARAGLMAMLMAGAAGFSGAMAQDAGTMGGVSLTAIAGGSAVVAVIGLVLIGALASPRLKSSSLFNRLFVVVAVTAGFFSAISSAIGFGLITSQESADIFRNSILPPAFGVFVFCLAVAIWVGGADFVRHRDWFRGLKASFLGDIVFFIERAVKLFIIVPLLATILFFVSTWTTVVGIGGVDAVRHTYSFEIDRLAAECAGITAWRQRDFLAREDLRLSVGDVTRVADAERRGGSQSGSRGDGAVTEYITGLANWYEGLLASVDAIIAEQEASANNPYDQDTCARHTDELKKKLAQNAYDNVDRWNREFETAFNDFAAVINLSRRDKRVERLLDQQLDAFARANPKPSDGRVSDRQREAIDAYAAEVESALQSTIRSQKLQKPEPPLKSAAELSPARGLDIFREIFNPPPPPEEPEKVSRAQSVVDSEFIPGLSTITPRDAVLKNASIFSDVWALAISWDYAPYILMLAFLFFPSAERAAGYKD